MGSHKDPSRSTGIYGIYDLKWPLQNHIPVPVAVISRGLPYPRVTTTVYVSRPQAAGRERYEHADDS